MPLLPKEFRDNLVDIANDLQDDHYRRTLKRNLKPALDQFEKEEIIIACERIISFINGKEKEEFIKGYLERERIKRIFRRQSKDGTLNSKDSITYTGLPESTFYRKIKDYDPVKGEDGKSRHKIDDLDKIARLLTDSSNSYKSALCIETHYCYDGNRRGFFPFESGEYYKVADEDETSKYVFNEKWNVTIRVGNQSFRNNFRVYEDLDLIVSQFNERERLKSSIETSQKSSLFYTVKKAAALLKVSEQTIHNLIVSGKIASRSIDGNIRFTYEDLMTFCLNSESDMAICLEDIVYIDKEKQYVVAFEKDKLYKITNENNICVSLFSNKWEKSARFPKKRFSKLFSIAEEWQIETSKYGFLELG